MTPEFPTNQWQIGIISLRASERGVTELNGQRERERERERKKQRKISDIDGQTDRQTQIQERDRKVPFLLFFFSALLSVESFVWLISMSSRMFARPFRIIKRRQICNV